MARRSTALLLFLVALAMWAGYGGLILVLSRERAAYAEEYQSAAAEKVRGDSAARVRTVVQNTEAERAALESLIQGDILRAVEVIEQAGESAGAGSVEIGQATSVEAPDGLVAATIVVNAEGSFTSLMRTLALFEVLPIPSALEQFELEQPDDEGAGWRLTARLRVLSRQ